MHAGTERFEETLLNGTQRLYFLLVKQPYNIFNPLINKVEKVGNVKEGLLQQVLTLLNNSFFDMIFFFDVIY